MKTCNEVVSANVDAACRKTMAAANTFRRIATDIELAAKSGDNDSLRLSDIYDGLSQAAELAEETKTLVTCAQAYVAVRRKLLAVHA